MAKYDFLKGKWEGRKSNNKITGNKNEFFGFFLEGTRNSIVGIGGLIWKILIFIIIGSILMYFVFPVAAIVISIIIYLAILIAIIYLLIKFWRYPFKHIFTTQRRF